MPVQLWHPNIQCAVVAPPSNAAAALRSKLQQGNISDLNLAIDTSCPHHTTGDPLTMPPLQLPNGDAGGINNQPREHQSKLQLCFGQHYCNMSMLIIFQFTGVKLIGPPMPLQVDCLTFCFVPLQLSFAPVICCLCLRLVVSNIRPHINHFRPRLKHFYYNHYSIYCSGYCGALICSCECTINCHKTKMMASVQLAFSKQFKIGWVWYIHDQLSQGRLTRMIFEIQIGNLPHCTHFHLHEKSFLVCP